MPIDKEGIPKQRTSSSTGARHHDASVVVKVGDLINMAMGPTEKNTVNFKLIQTILRILARNMRLLDQQVEVRSSDVNLSHLFTKEKDEASVQKDLNEKHEEKSVEAGQKSLKENEKGEKEIAKYKETKSSVASSNNLKDKGGREKADIDAQDSERARREMDAKEKAELAHMDDETKSTYLKDKEERESLSADILKHDEVNKDLTDSEQYTETLEIERPKSETTLAKMKMIRKVYLREMSDLSSPQVDEEEEKHLVDEDEKQRAKFGTMVSERTENDEKEKSEKAKLGEMNAREKARLAHIDDKSRAKYLQDKEERGKADIDAQERERVRREIMEAKEKAKLANIDHESRAKYLENKEESEKADTDTQDRKRARTEIDERDKVELAHMNDETRAKYLKDKEGREKADIDAQDSERARRKMDAKEKAELAHMDDETKSTYLKDKEERESLSADILKHDEVNKDLTDSEQYTETLEIERPKSETTLAKMKMIRKVYLREMSDLSSPQVDEEEEKHLVDEDEKQRAKFGTMVSERTENDEKEKSEKAKLGEMNARERARLAHIDDKSRAKYLEDKEERGKADIDAQERERVRREIMEAKEKAKLANIDHESRAKYLENKEESEKADTDTQDRKRARTEIDERDKVELAHMNDETRAKYLKDKEGREKADIDAQDSERARRKMDAKEKAELAHMDDETKSTYLKDKEERESLSADILKHDEVNKDLTDSKQYTETLEIERPKSETTLAKMKIIRKVYLREMSDLSSPQVDEEEEKHLVDKDEKQRAKFGTMVSERTENDEKEKSEKAKLGKMNAREKAKLAHIDDKSRAKYLEDKEERGKADIDAQERERVRREMMEAKEKAKLANMDHESRAKYLENQEESEKADTDTQDRKRARTENEEREKVELAHMNDETRAKYLKDKEGREKADIDAQDSERARREMDAKEKAELAYMDDETKSTYLKDKEEREKFNVNAQDRERTRKEMDESEKAKTAKLDETKVGKYLQQKDKGKTDKSKSDALYRERPEKGKDEKEKEKMPLMNETESPKKIIEKEKEKLEEKDREREDSDKEIERKQYLNELEKIENMDDETREKYLKDKEVGEKEDIGERARREKDKKKKEKDTKEKAKLAHMDDETRAKYLKVMKEGENDEIDGQDREGAEGVMQVREKAKIAKLDETEGEKYFKQEEEKETLKSKFDVLDRETAEKEPVNGQEREKERRREKEKETERKTEEEKEREKEEERKREKEIEKGKDREREKQRDKNLKEKEWAKARDSKTRVGSIEVVTRPEFERLEQKVNELQEKTAPIPYPSMPDNQKLRTDLAKGSASLTDTMQAMQVSARVQAAESAMALMADLLTQLAAAGAVPEDMMEQVEEVTAGLSRPSSSKGPGGRNLSKSPRPRASDKSSRSAINFDERIRNVASTIGGIGTNKSAQSSVRIAKEGQTRISVGQSVNTDGALGGKRYTGITTASKAHFIKECVTHSQLDDAQRDLKDQMIKKINELVQKALRLAELADMNVTKVADQMSLVSDVSGRITSLYNLINDYAEQLAGYDAGVSMQLQNFNELIFQIRCELNDGKALFNTQLNNSETEAVKELKVKYEDLVIDLDSMKNTLDKLSFSQNTMGDEMMNLMKSVEAIREAKADHEELIDGIRDKADKSLLDNLLEGWEFEEAKLQMDQKLSECYNRFKKQEKVWMSALEDLKAFAAMKASGNELFNFTYDTEINLNKMRDEVQLLATSMGQPKAMLLARKVSEGGTCGPCRAPAFQAPTAACQPPVLEAARRHPPLPEEPCGPTKLPRHLDEREHFCKRWTGGSHTLINQSVVHQDSEAIEMHMPPTMKYIGIGKDGKTYQLEEILQPCADCKPLGTEETHLQEEGAGEPGVKKMHIDLKNT